MSKKHIAIVTRALRNGGAERVIAQLANYFVTQNMSCTVLTIENSQTEYELDSRVHLIPIGKQSSNKILDRIKQYASIRRIVKQRHVDLILSMPETIGIYVILAMLGSGIPVVVSERNNPWVMPDVKITRILRKFAYPFAKGLIFQTEMAKSFFPKSIQKKGVVLPNPVDASRIPEQYQGERRKVIAGAGRLHHQKNFTLLIDAFSEFYKSNPEYQLVIYGEGPLREQLQSQIHALGLEGVAHLPGRNKKLLEEIKDCAMFVLSSDYEGSPNVLIEAMCMGMPVIATDCPSGGPRELIKHQENGLLIPVGEKAELLQALLLAADGDTAKALSREAYKQRSVLTSGAIFTRWADYLRSI